jgi:thioredoxin reductase
VLRPARTGAPPLTVVMQTATGEKTVECHRIIARLGAMPPRKFVESIGIKFPNERNDAIPELSRHYESNVPGVYVIGSLAGYPLIKQAMNQGYDVSSSSTATTSSPPTIRCSSINSTACHSSARPMKCWSASSS